MRLLCVLVLCLLWFPVGLLAEEYPRNKTCSVERLVFSMIPKKDIDEQLREYQPLISLLSEGLGMPVEVVRASSYQSVMDSLVSGALDVAVLGPAAYVRVRSQNPDIEAFASLAVQSGHFTPAGSFYYSVLLVNRDSEATEPGDLEGARVALTDPNSTSGALIPQTEFADAIQRPLHRFFARQVYAGSHDKAINALLADKVDAAFVSSSRVDEYVARGMVGPDRFRVVWKSSPLHYDPFVFRSDLCEPIRRNVERLMTTPSKQRRQFLDSQQATEITRVSHEDYRPLERLIENRN
ncbi:MAG: phosphate/phosphite/phosphonate ABC transporter substrate-binding protein [Marinobacter sp.]|nr:phosphate/phosphite/phosphonate ABC transporter substrate-binding protein [Marinobacter sp.]